MDDDQSVTRRSRTDIQAILTILAKHIQRPKSKKRNADQSKEDATPNTESSSD
ncbi:hypothetical protein [Leptothermofonsia sp. ETS-13]|uniref:hypothetical protein n=1 Tax=Leptothermofonsia sp. ETS-13 TaxID=3035696 RepID=UPI003BA23313